MKISVTFEIDVDCENIRSGSVSDDQMQSFLEDRLGLYGDSYMLPIEHPLSMVHLRAKSVTFKKVGG